MQHAHVLIIINQNHKASNMGILENLENAWDNDFLFESKPMQSTDNMGRPTDDSSLAVKIFSETCCSGCSCKNE